MSTNPSPFDYNPSPSRLVHYKTCSTPISGELWLRHLRTIEAFEAQASKLGLIEVALELAILRAEHISAQLRCELFGGDHGLLK